jgi:zinc protease
MSSTNIEQIKKPILKELENFETQFRQSMKTKVPLLDTIMTYIVKRKGKQIRPIFVLYSAALFGEINDKTLYPVGHPYSWTTIGVLEDLDRANVDDLKNFFMRWYGPNNATIVIAGDVTPSDVVALCDKYFGPIPRGPEVKKMKVDAVMLPDNRYATYYDNITFPLTQLTFPGVPSYNNDEAALDILLDILSSGNNSWLYQTFDKQEKAVFSTGFNACYELTGEIQFQIYSFPGSDLGETEKLFYTMLSDFEKKGISDEDMLRAKGKLQSTLFNSVESIRGKSSLLSVWQYRYLFEPELPHSSLFSACI